MKAVHFSSEPDNVWTILDSEEEDFVIARVRVVNEEPERIATLFAAAPILWTENIMLTAQIQKMREMLKRQEWSDGIRPAFFCYACNRHKTLGHRDDCELAALLKETE